MHPMALVGGGFVLLAVFVLGARFTGLSMTGAALAFIPFWLVSVFFSQRCDGTRIGGAAAGKLSSLAVVYAIPVLAALYLWWTYWAA
jgi:hypothetical protein